MAGYESSRSPGLWQRFMGYLGAAGRGVGSGVSNYTSNIGNRLQNGSLMSRAGQVIDFTAPVATALREGGRGAIEGLRGESQRNAEMAHDLDVLRNDPGYTGSYSSGGNGSGYAGVFAGSPANSFLTGSFSPSQMGQGGSQPLVNLNYGQNAQQHQMQGGGLPGITGPNIYAGAPSYNGNQLSAMSSGNGNGTGGQWGTISMSQLENMLSAGGMNNRAAMMTPRREMDEMRAAQNAAGNKRQPGQSVRDYLMQ